jgi:glycosyltransferase involved in cell wall biosynthesis
MAMDRTTISVVIPSLNQARFLERAIKSVLAQQFPGLELFVLDGGSTDGSVEIIRRYESHLTYWNTGEDAGQSDAILQGWTRATGGILAWLNADDYYAPDAFKRVVSTFENDREIVMACGVLAIVNETGDVLRLKKPPRVTAEHLLPWGTVPGQPSVFLRREVFEKLGGPRRDLHYVLDWEYWLRVALNYPASAICYFDEVLANATEWKLSKTCQAAGRDAAEVDRVLRELFDRNHLPPALAVLKKKAFARQWWRRAESESAAGKRSEALTSFVEALKLAPLEFSCTEIVRQSVRIYRTPAPEPATS